MSKHYTPQELVDGFSELHTLPEVYFRVKKVVDDPTSQIADLVREVGNDPALTARVLKVVNSPLYRMSGTVETLLRAVNVLGTRAIHDLVLATSVTGMITRRTIGDLDMRTHWRESLAIGMLARAIGEACKIVDRDRLFVEGLLSRLGQVVMHERIGAVVSVIAKHAMAKKIALHLAQRNFLGCHYGDTGAALLRKWKLPESICAALIAHLDPPSQEEAADVGILRLAADLAPCIDTAPTEASLSEILSRQTAAALPLDPHQARTLLHSTRTELAMVQQVIAPGTANAA